MFGPNPGQPDAAQPMVDWINGTSPAEVASELMAAFASDEPRPVSVLSVSEFGDWMFRGYPEQTGLILRARPVQESILEAIQLFEHSELVYVRWITDNEFRWSATRLGLSTLAEGKQAARQRIKDRTGL